MAELISRRKLLSTGIKTGVGLALLNNLSLTPFSVVAFSREAERQTDRFLPAYKLLDEFIARHMKDVGAPGMTLAIADRKGLLRTSQYGFADLKAGVKVSPQTLFEIGSISKSFVGIAVLRAADEGKIDLHKPVVSYLPWLKVESKYAPFTAHHLLSHTAGLSSVPLLMRVAASTLRTGSEPGTRFLYSNIGYVLLGFLLEAVEKRPFAEVLRKRVLEPLGMSSSEPVITNASRERMAVGYGPLHEDRPFPLRGKLAEAPWLEVPEAAGSVTATAGDMVAYLQFLLNRGVGPRGRVLSEKSFQLLVQPVIKAPFRGEEASYSYGLWISEIAGNTLARHTGGMVAFSSAMHADLTKGLGVFASVNANLRGYRPNVVVKYALDLLRATLSDQGPPAAPPSPPEPDQIANAAAYAGSYNSPDGGKLQLVAQDEQLILRHKGQRIALEQAGRDRFIVKHPDFELFALTFGRQEEAVVQAFHGESWWTNEKYKGTREFESPQEWKAYVGRYRSDSPWYGSTRVVIRKDLLLLDGEQTLTQIETGVFRPEGDNNEAELVTFNTIVNGTAMRMNYSGIDFYRTFTP